VLLFLVAFTPIVGQVVNLFGRKYSPGQGDILAENRGNSWAQINQNLTGRPEGWRQIVPAGAFVLGKAVTTVTPGNYPTIDGSTVMVPMALEFARQHLDPRFEKDLTHLASFTTTPYAYEKLFTPNEEVFGPIALEDGMIEYRPTGRPLDLFLGTAPGPGELAIAAQNGVTPVIRPICRDAFVFITHKDNPVESLTLEQVRGIFSGKITNWKEVGGGDEAIRAFQREPGSGSQTGMEDLLMKGLPMAPAKMVSYVSSMAGLIENVAEYQNGTASIGYPYKYYIDNLYKNEDIKILQIEGVAPGEQSIVDETYPLSVNYYGVIRAGDEEQPGGLFLDWILSDEGQACVRQAGYVPIRP
jgi:phosphate transport system substrate-binding protein